MRDALALALVHFLWQGIVLGLAGAALMRIAGVPTVRYAIGVATMLAMAVAPAATFLAIRSNNSELAVLGLAAIEPVAAIWSNASASVSKIAAGNSAGAGALDGLPTSWILTVWFAGVSLLSLRFVGGWSVARRLATHTLTPVGLELQAVAGQLAARLNVRGAVRVYESASVAVPMMIGCLRPVIVLPPAALAALPLSQIEALLAHELAHVRRHDYLVNLLQTAVETLCFYHPAVWWMSRAVRRHREDCCDDVAVGVCDRLTYVTALSSIAAMATPQLALSATGGSLRDRVRRLVEPSTTTASPKGAWIAMLPIILVASLVAPHAWAPQASASVEPPPVHVTPAVEVPVAGATEVSAESPGLEQAQPPVRASESRRAAEQARTVMDRVRAAEHQRLENERAASQEERRLQQLGLEAERTLQRAGTEERARALNERRAAQEIEQTMAQQRLLMERQSGLAGAAARDLEKIGMELEQHQRSLEQHRQLREKGLVTERQVHEAEDRVASVRRMFENVRLHRQFAETDHELAVHERALSMSGMHRELDMLDASARLQAGDHLTITVAGEPDLPREYMVRDDGSIRFPFLGAVRVQGSTASQVQSAIQKLISDKGLGRNASVTVSAGRPR